MVAFSNPLVDIELYLPLVDEAGDNARDTKMYAFFEVLVDVILVFWEHETCGPSLEEVNTAYIILLKENILVFIFEKGLEEWADPDDESEGLVFEEA